MGYLLLNIGLLNLDTLGRVIAAMQSDGRLPLGDARIGSTNNGQSDVALTALKTEVRDTFVGN